MFVVDYDKAAQRRRLATVYIGVVGPENENGQCRDSIQNLNLRPGDDLGPRYIRATKGYEARQSHIDTFLNETNHGAILLLDHDQIVPANTLEQLRSYGLPFMTGYYMRRHYNPIAPVWYEYPEHDEWPMKPFLNDPERGRLHRLGGSGWGCVLLHREVLEAVRPLLKGEWFVLEDDMDVWPYDLRKMLKSIQMLGVHLDGRMNKSKQRKAQLLAEFLAGEFRPLRATHDPLGSDLRFPFFARQAGYDLYGDPDVRIGHMLDYPLHPDDFSNADPNYQDLRKKMDDRVAEGRARHFANLERLTR